MFGKKRWFILGSCLLLLGLVGECLGAPGPPDQAKLDAELKKELDQLVASNIITEKQELTIIEYFQKLHSEPPSGPPPTPGQGAPEEKGPLSSLVKEGVITEEQARAVEKVLPKPPQPKGDSANFPSPPTGSNDTKVIAPTAVYAQSDGNVTKSKQNYTAAKVNQSVINVTKSGLFTLNDATISKTGDTSATENSDFYGLNAAVLAGKAGRIILNDCTITTNARGAQGVFATGTGSSVTLKNVTIKTTADSSRGLDATYSGTVTATECDITTAGAHSAALATDRGEGTIRVSGGTMTTSGTDSPPIYSTGTFIISGATLSGIGSEAAVIEGANSISLTNCVLSGAKKRGVMIYQSMSGDAEGTRGVFTMTGGSLTAAEGPLFYVTNSTGVVKIANVNATATSGILIQAKADRWGSGSNGGTVFFIADNQSLAGDLMGDNLSSITATLINNSSLEGMINTDHTAASIALNLDETSTWHVTGTSYLTTLIDLDTTLANIDDNGFTIYYDATAGANSWLGNQTYQLAGGGKLAPEKIAL